MYDPSEKKKKRKNLKSGPEGNIFLLLARDGGPHKSKFVAILPDGPSFVVQRDAHSVESNRNVPSFPEWPSENSSFLKSILRKYISIDILPLKTLCVWNLV